MVIRLILVPVDFSDDSLEALAYARDCAALGGAQLLILHVVEPVYYATPADMYVTTPNLTMLLDEQRRTASEQLTRIGADLKTEGRRVRTAVKTGSPAQVIVDSASSAKADLIVMATHGRTGLSHMLMGSVAERVVRHAACPVLTVRGGAATRRPARRQARRSPGRR